MNRPVSICRIGLAALFLSACTTLAQGQIPGIAAPANSTPPATSTAIVWFPATLTPTAATLPTRQPTPDQKPGVGGVLLIDDFSSGTAWNTAVSSQAAVTLTGNGLTIAAQPGLAPVASFRKGTVFSDMYVEVRARASLCRGADEYGLLFRTQNSIAFYRFAVACNGTAAADRISLGGARVLQAPTASGDVPLAAPGDVQLGVWAVGSEFRFFLNGRYQFTVSDKSYSTGGIGLFAHAAGETPAIVTFSDLSVYTVNPPSGSAPTP